MLEQDRQFVKPQLAAASASCLLLGFNDTKRQQQLDWHKQYQSLRTLREAKKFDNAIDLAERCLNSAPQLFEAPEVLQASCHLEIGLTRIGAGHLERAINSFKSGLSICQADPSARMIKVHLQSNLAEAFASQNKIRTALATFIISLRSIDELSKQDPMTSKQVAPLKIGVLKEITALCISLGKHSKAERFLYALASLQTPGMERGKTLLLLAQTYRSNNQIGLALKTAKCSQTEMLNGATNSSDKLALANAFRLQARLHFDNAELVEAHNAYTKTYMYLKDTQGPNDIRTVIAACDIALVDTRFKRWNTAEKNLNSNLNLAIQLSDTGSNNPLMLTYLDAHARVAHHIGGSFRKALEILGDLPDRNLTLSGFEKQLRVSKLRLIWEPIFQNFINGLERESLSRFLNDKITYYLELALTRYTQVASSLQNRHGKNYSGLADVYELMSYACQGLGETEQATRIKGKAEFIRQKNRKQNGGDY